MLTSIKSSYQKYNAKLQSRNFYKRIKSELSVIKGFHLKEFFITEDMHRGIAIDRTSHKLVLIKISEEHTKYSVIHCSDLKSVHLYRDGSAINSATNRLLPQQHVVQADIQMPSISPTFIKLTTAQKSNINFIIPFDDSSPDSIPSRSRPQNEPEYWFDMCREVIHKSEQKSEALKSRQHLMS